MDAPDGNPMDPRWPAEGTVIEFRHVEPGPGGGTWEFSDDVLIVRADKFLESRKAVEYSVASGLCDDDRKTHYQSMARAVWVTPR